MPGDIIPPLVDSLPGCEWKDAPNMLMLSSSVDCSGADMMLDERLGNNGRGGTSPAASKESFLSALSGDEPRE